MYQDLVVPVHLTGKYGYAKEGLGNVAAVKSHLRENVCQLKPCIWVCCRYKDMQPNGKCRDGGDESDQSLPKCDPPERIRVQEEFA